VLSRQHSLTTPPQQDTIRVNHLDKPDGWCRCRVDQQYPGRSRVISNEAAFENLLCRNPESAWLYVSCSSAPESAKFKFELANEVAVLESANFELSIDKGLALNSPILPTLD